jgi:hypothetical protein
VPLTLASVVDKADGTGAVLTVTGSSGGVVTANRATVTVSSLGAFASTGVTRVGDGTGYYRWNVTEGVSTSNEIYQPATAEGDSIWDRCVTMIADRIRSLNLPGLTGGVVTDKELPLLNELTYPCVVLTTANEQEESAGDSNMTDDITYPVIITVGEDRGDDAQNYNQRWKMWRERIRNSINEHRWDYRVFEVWKVVAVPGVALDATHLNQVKHAFGLLTANCVAKVRRGPVVAA